MTKNFAPLKEHSKQTLSRTGRIRQIRQIRSGSKVAVRRSIKDALLAPGLIFFQHGQISKADRHRRLY